MNDYVALGEEVHFKLTEEEMNPSEGYVVNGGEGCLQCGEYAVRKTKRAKYCSTECRQKYNDSLRVRVNGDF